MGGKSSRRAKGCACVQTRRRPPVPDNKHVAVHSRSSVELVKAKQQHDRHTSIVSNASGHPTFSIRAVATVVEENKEAESAGCRALTDNEKVLLKISWKELRKAGLMDNLVSTYIHGFIHSAISKDTFPLLETSKKNLMSRMEEASGNVHVHQTLNTIDLAIDHLDSLYTIAQPLRKMGARHVGYNVCSHEYLEFYTLALFHALQVIQHFDPHSTVAHAWTVLLSYIRSQMTIGVLQMTRSELRSPPCPGHRSDSSSPDRSGKSRMSSITSNGYISPVQHFATLYQSINN